MKLSLSARIAEHVARQLHVLEGEGVGVRRVVPRLHQPMLLRLLQGPAEDLLLPFEPEAGTYADGTIIHSDGLKVTALHNEHLGKPARGKSWQSFSFRIETAGRAIVSSLVII